MIIKIPIYDDYIEFNENNGWKRNHKIISEKDSEFVQLYNLKKAETGIVVKVKLPEEHVISVRGYKNDGKDDFEKAYKLKLCLFDINNRELNQFTNVRITNELERVFYADIRTDKYRFKNSFQIAEIVISVISDASKGGSNLPDIDIYMERTKFLFEFDLWGK